MKKESPVEVFSIVVVTAPPDPELIADVTPP